MNPYCTRGEGSNVAGGRGKESVSLCSQVFINIIFQIKAFPFLKQIFILAGKTITCYLHSNRLLCCSTHLCGRSTHLSPICIFLPHLLLRCPVAGNRLSIGYMGLNAGNWHFGDRQKKYADKLPQCVFSDSSVRRCQGCISQSYVIRSSEIREAQVE